MTDWIATIVGTPYLVAPLVAWLWAKAEFPEVKWGKVAAGALLTFGGELLKTLILALGPFLANEWMTWPGSLISLAGTASTIVGLAVMGFYVLYGALITWKSHG